MFSVRISIVGIAGPVRLALRARLDRRGLRMSPVAAGIILNRASTVRRYMTLGHQAKLFQPLFTTRARGIGPWLVVVKDLVEANGGSVAVPSRANLEREACSPLRCRTPAQRVKRVDDLVPAMSPIGPQSARGASRGSGLRGPLLIGEMHLGLS